MKLFERTEVGLMLGSKQFNSCDGKGFRHLKGEDSV